MEFMGIEIPLTSGPDLTGHNMLLSCAGAQQV